MSRLTTEFTPEASAAKILDDLKKSIGRVPNIYKIMAHSPAVLTGYTAFSDNLKNGSLNAQDQQHIALVVAGYDKCVYCASAHTLMAHKAGISSEEATNNIHNKSDSSSTSTLLNFCTAILQTKGKVSDQDMAEIRNAGFSDTQIVEIVANVCANIFTNYFNHVVATDVDFPEVSVE